MSGIKNLNALLNNMTPILNKGHFVFASVKNPKTINLEDALGIFREKEGTTIILEQCKADELNLKYDFIASWITLSVHSSLDAVGLTASFSNALANESISCNVVAGFYHDHIFVNHKHAQKAMLVLQNISRKVKTL